MFWTRLASGIVLVIIALAALSFGGAFLAFLLWAISMVGLRELTKALQCASSPKGLNALEILGMAGVTAYYLVLFFSGQSTLLLVCIVGLIMAEMLVYVVTFPKFNASQVTAVVFSFLYAPVMLSFVYQTRTCAYVVGKLVGKKKIFPKLSPKKSLEGCIGGVLGAGALGWLYGHFFAESAFPDQTVSWMIAVICAVGAVMSMVGDLAASAIKRDHDIKDYGKLIPGHGGVMDRFDSMIVTAPMTYFLTIFLLAVD